MEKYTRWKAEGRSFRIICILYESCFGKGIKCNIGGYCAVNLPFFKYPRYEEMPRKRDPDERVIQETYSSENC
ncbi:hypothetical protein L1887_06057 [Cichorium endivia]|nr:hypothetical protein L1887_06057 [Cichorium endivia]